MLILLVACTDDGPGPELEPVILAKYIVLPHPSSGGSNMSPFLLQRRIVPDSGDLYFSAFTPGSKH